MALVGCFTFADKTRFGHCVRDFCNFLAFNLAMRIPHLELDCIANSFVSVSIYRSQMMKTLHLMIPFEWKHLQGWT